MIPDLLTKLFGQHWRTSAIGCMTAFFAFVAFAPVHFPSLIVDLGKFATIGGLAAMGIASKDKAA